MREMARGHRPGMVTNSLVLQCARVDKMPNTTGKDPDLPNVTDGSRVTGCAVCRQQVWISRPARALFHAEGIKPVCDDCRPAKATSIHRDVTGRPT